MISLVTLLSNGNQIEKESAFVICQFLAKKQHAGAMYRLALFYRDGVGTEVDEVHYKEWMSKAASLDYPRAIEDVKGWNNDSIVNKSNS